MAKTTWVSDDLDGERAQVGDFYLCAHPTLDGYGAAIACGGNVIARSPRIYTNMELAKLGAYVLAEKVLTAALSDVRLMRQKHPKPPRGVGWRGKKTA